MKLSDFKINEVVIYHTEQYDCDTKSYSPIKKMATVKKIGDLGVTIELERGQNPDYNMHIGSGCLDCLEKIGDSKVVPLQKRAKRLVVV
jgi:hypothetical protein